MATAQSNAMQLHSALLIQVFMTHTLVTQ